MLDWVKSLSDEERLIILEYVNLLPQKFFDSSTVTQEEFLRNILEKRRVKDRDRIDYEKYLEFIRLNYVVKNTKLLDIDHWIFDERLTRVRAKSCG